MNKTKLTDALNVILADAHIMTAKLHNYHWNVYGLQFYAIHQTTEGYYDYFFGLFDDIAERMLQLGAKPAATVKSYLELTTLKEDEGDRFDPVTVLANIKADFGAFLAAAKAAFKLAEESDDTGTQDLLGGFIVKLEKELWLIKSSLGK